MGFIVLYIPSNVSKSVRGFYYSEILDFWKSARRRFPAKVNSSVINAGEFRLFIRCSSKEGEQQRINTALLQKCSYSSAGLSMTSDLKSFICHQKRAFLEWLLILCGRWHLGLRSLCCFFLSS